MKASLRLLLPLCLTAHLEASSVVISPTADFFTSNWAFGAPYVLDAGRDHLGISGSNPYGMDPSGAWAEVTYLTFDFSTLGAVGSSVSSAILTFTTVPRSGISNSAINLSAHYLLANPATSIDPTLGSSSPGSFYDFQSNKIAGVIDTVFVDSASVYQLDLTPFVNEWLSNGESNYSSAIALAGLQGNESYPDGWTAIVNGGYNGAAYLTVTVPETGSTLLSGLGGVLLLSRRKRR